MEHYVTLFDSLFLPQGLALHRSMQRHAGSHTLWVLCMDEQCHEVLGRLDLPNVQLLRLADFETPELQRVKAGRSRGEYCWTITPFSVAFVFETAPSVSRVTYLDTDVWFCSNPQIALEELDRSGKSVLITEHGYAPQYDQSKVAGRFCVQFTSFVRGAGDVVRQWWAERCLEWCFARVDAGRFGDQMYLDEWPSRFGAEVHVLQALSLCQAPWNALRFDPRDAMLYHFHGLRLLSNREVWLVDGHRLPAQTVDAIYRPYLHDLGTALDRLASVGHNAKAQLPASKFTLRLREMARRALSPDRHCLTPMLAKAGSS